MKFLNKEYINLVKEFTIAWMKIKDKKSIFGLLWSFLNPLVSTAVLFLLFKNKLNFDGDRNYFLSILIGMVSWNFFSISVQAAMRILIDRHHMVRSVIFPKEILIISQVTAQIIQHLFELIVVFIFMFILSYAFSPLILLLPIIILLEALIILSTSLVIAHILTYAYDIEHIWSIFTRIGFFLVPIFYQASSLSPRFRWIIEINPLTQIIYFYRDVLIYHRFPNIYAFILVSLFSLLFIIISFKSFKSQESIIVERLA